jgi:hypothetical protein
MTMAGQASSISCGSSAALRAPDATGALGGLGGGLGGGSGGLGGGGLGGGGLGGGGLGGGGEHCAKHSSAPANDVVPGGHGVHVALPVMAANEPAAHGAHADCPGAALAEPRRQSRQNAMPDWGVK